MSDSRQERDLGRDEARDPNNQVTRAECGAAKTGGGRCTLKPVLGLQNCYAHAPELEGERHAARVRGGLAATHQRVLAAETPRAGLGSEEEARLLLEETIHDVRLGRVTPAIASTVFYGVSVAVRLAELKLGAQLAELEQELARHRRAR